MKRNSTMREYDLGEGVRLVPNRPIGGGAWSWDVEFATSVSDEEGEDWEETLTSPLSQVMATGMVGELSGRSSSALPIEAYSRLRSLVTQLTEAGLARITPMRPVSLQSLSRGDEFTDDPESGKTYSMLGFDKFDNKYDVVEKVEGGRDRMTTLSPHQTVFVPVRTNGRMGRRSR
jgi:hypothetical protein